MWGNRDDEIIRRLVRIEAQGLTNARRIAAVSAQLSREERQMAKSLDDILGAQAATMTKITAMKTVDDGISALVTSQKTTLADLQAQLDAAIAAGDMAKVQTVSDNMDAINAALDAQAAAEAVVAGTPAA